MSTEEKVKDMATTEKNPPVKTSGGLRKKRKIWDPERGIVSIEDSRPSVMSATVVDLTEISDNMYAFRGSTKAVEILQNVLKNHDSEFMPMTAVWPSDFADWICDKHGFNMKSYALQDIELENGKLRGNGKFDPVGEQGLANELSGKVEIEKITVEGGVPKKWKMQLAKGGALSTSDKQADNGFLMFRDYLLFFHKDEIEDEIEDETG